MTEHGWLPVVPVGEDGRPYRTDATEAAQDRFQRGPARWRAWLGLGPSRRDLYAAVAVLRYSSVRVSADMRAAHVRAKAAEKDARQARQEATEQIAAAVAAAFEPSMAGCTKIRLHTVAGAEEYAARTAAELRMPVGSFEVYRCKTCPRHPATGQRFLHIANRDPALRGESGKAAKGRQARSAARGRLRDGNVRLADSADPTALTRLRDRFNQGEPA